MNKAEQLIACLEGEIAKRDETIARLEPQLNRAIQANYDLREELAACRIAVENCELFRARIAELEQDLAYFPSTVRSLAETVTEREAEINQLRSELDAIKAQGTVGEVVGWYRLDRPYEMTPYPSVCATWHMLGAPVAPLYAAHAQQVIVPDGWMLVPTEPTPGMIDAALRSEDASLDPRSIVIADYRAMLAAAPAAPAAPAVDAGLIEARKANNELVNDLHVMTNKRRQLVDALTYLRECLDPDDYMGEISMHDFIDDALAAHRAKGVV